MAREAVQMAEDARIITIKRIDEERLSNERKAGADREARAESERAKAQANADKTKEGAAEAQFVAQSEALQSKRVSDAKIETARNDADKARKHTAAQMAAAQSKPND